MRGSKLISWGSPKDATLQSSFQKVLKMFTGTFSEALRISNSLLLSISYNAFEEQDRK